MTTTNIYDYKFGICFGNGFSRRQFVTKTQVILKEKKNKTEDKKCTSLVLWQPPVAPSQPVVRKRSL
jgi:hypothetical protein